MSQPTRALFDGVFLGGFECSCLRRRDGQRLDLLEATRHAEWAERDYARLRGLGMTACRDGVSWVECEAKGFARTIRMMQAAERQGMQVLWDLVHFGWPDDVDPFSPGFPTRVARFARAFAEVHRDHTSATPWITPVNEMSFLAWAGADVGVMNPWTLARGVELKAQLVRATLEAIEAVRDVSPHARFVQPEPLIHLHEDPAHPKTFRRVEADNLLQFQAWDMLVGDVFPSLGGHPRYLDVIGVNYYPENQFMLDGRTVPRDDPRHRPLHELLLHAFARYRRPMFVAETGTEGDARAGWLRYVVDECLRAMERGCELHGITLYPVLEHPGWEDDRHCPNGLWGYADDEGERPLHAPLAEVIEHSSADLRAARRALLEPGVAAA